MFGLFNNPKREIKQLNKDARVVIDTARQTYRAERLRDIALLTRDGLRQTADLCGDDQSCREREIARYKTLHRESRSHFNQVGLTAYTLIIIHLRSRAFGEACAAARQVIGEFIAEWDHSENNEDVLPG